MKKCHCKDILNNRNVDDHMKIGIAQFKKHVENELTIHGSKITDNFNMWYKKPCKCKD